MRNVTNNKPAKPSKEEVKRGRGRPRKPDAMTNAQRQAAYRQRKNASLINVTVTKNDDARRQMQTLRAELLEARHALAQLRVERDRLSASAGHDSAPGFEVMLKLLAMACKRKPVNAQLAIRESDVWRNGVASASGVSNEQMKRVAAALAGNLT